MRSYRPAGDIPNMEDPTSRDLLPTGLRLGELEISFYSIALQHCQISLMDFPSSENAGLELVGPEHAKPFLSITNRTRVPQQ